MHRTGGISTVDGDEEVTIDNEMGRGDGVGKSESLGDGVCSESQSSVHSVGEKR